MTKWITTKGGRPVVWMLEDLLSLGAERLHSLKGSVQVVHMNIEMHRRPVTLELAAIYAVR